MGKKDHITISKDGYSGSSKFVSNWMSVGCLSGLTLYGMNKHFDKPFEEIEIKNKQNLMRYKSELYEVDLEAKRLANYAKELANEEKRLENEEKEIRNQKARFENRKQEDEYSASLIKKKK